MARKVWKPVIEGKPHVIEVKYSIWGNGELLVDGRIIDAWSMYLIDFKARHFEVAGKPAILVGTALSYDLIIDGQKIK